MQCCSDQFHAVIKYATMRRSSGRICLSWISSSLDCVNHFPRIAASQHEHQAGHDFTRTVEHGGAMPHGLPKRTSATSM